MLLEGAEGGISVQLVNLALAVMVESNCLEKRTRTFLPFLLHSFLRHDLYIYESTNVIIKDCTALSIFI